MSSPSKQVIVVLFSGYTHFHPLASKNITSSECLSQSDLRVIWQLPVEFLVKAIGIAPERKVSIKD